MKKNFRELQVDKYINKHATLHHICNAMLRFITIHLGSQLAF